MKYGRKGGILFLVKELSDYAKCLPQSIQNFETLCNSDNSQIHRFECWGCGGHKKHQSQVKSEVFYSSLLPAMKCSWKDSGPAGCFNLIIQAQWVWCGSSDTDFLPFWHCPAPSPLCFAFQEEWCLCCFKKMDRTKTIQDSALANWTVSEVSVHGISSSFWQQNTLYRGCTNNSPLNSKADQATGIIKVTELVLYASTRLMLSFRHSWC